MTVEHGSILFWIIIGILIVLVCLGAIPVLVTTFQFLVIPFHAVKNHYRDARPYLPRVAVIIPAWNEGAVIGESIDRLMRLEYPRESLRIYVVDDASTDDTPRVVQDKAAQYPGAVFHLRREFGGQGKAHTLNHGIRHVLADDWMQALLIMDADVIYLPDSLRKMTRHLADPRIGAVTAFIREGSGDKNYLGRFIAFEYVLAQLASRRAQNVLGAMACLAGGAQLHSRENLEDIGGEIDTSSLAEDTVTTFKTQLSGRRVVLEPYAVVLAEEPQTVGNLWKQRLRWARGNVQLTRRYKGLWFRPSRVHRLGSVSFGLFWFSVFLVLAFAILATIGMVSMFFMDPRIAIDVFRGFWILAVLSYVFTTVFAAMLDPVTSRVAWREIIFFPGIVAMAIMTEAAFPGLLTVRLPEAFGFALTPLGATIVTLLVYTWPAMAILAGFLIKAVDAVGATRWMAAPLTYLLGYGPILCAITMDSYVKEAQGASMVWDKTEKIGRVMG